MTDGAYRMVVRAHGGPEAIERETFLPRAPGRDELLIANEAIGLNFIDTYFRTGLYSAPLPLTLGSEAAGTIVAVGSAVKHFIAGERVGFAGISGAYATHSIIPAARAVRIPHGVSAQDAAASMLKGFTACYLAEDFAALSPGQVVLVHSAAGGVGSILVPWLRDKGVVVIAHAGSAEKILGIDADHLLSGDFAELPDAIRGITGGRGVDVVFDGVGKDSWSASLASLKRRGLMVSYGNASGAVPPVSLLALTQGGSLYVTRPSLNDYIATSDELESTASLLFDRISRGVVKVNIGQRFKLADAAEAHRALEGRRTVGSTILLP
jgi:NADPH2:quinone reductase